MVFSESKKKIIQYVYILRVYEEMKHVGNYMVDKNVEFIHYSCLVLCGIHLNDTQNNYNNSHSNQNRNNDKYNNQ